MNNHLESYVFVLSEVLDALHESKDLGFEISIRGLVVSSFLEAANYNFRRVGLSRCECLEEVLSIGAIHPRYVSELLFTAYNQIKDSLRAYSGFNWADDQMALVLYEIEQIYGHNLIDPTAEPDVA